MWVLAFVQERFHSTGPDDFESMFIKAKDSETKEGPTVVEATGERKSEKKRPLETGSQGKSRTNCLCPLLQV